MLKKYGASRRFLYKIKFLFPIPTEIVMWLWQRLCRGVVHIGLVAQPGFLLKFASRFLVRSWDLLIWYYGIIGAPQGKIFRIQTMFSGEINSFLGIDSYIKTTSVPTVSSWSNFEKKHRISIEIEAKPKQNQWFCVHIQILLWILDPVSKRVQQLVQFF